MHAASREALVVAMQRVDEIIDGSANPIPVAAQTGTELFEVVEALDADRGLRVAAADSSATAEQRSGLVRTVFDGKVSPEALTAVADAAAQVWSNPREMRAGLVRMGRHSLLRSAAIQGQLPQVEDELFRLGRTLDAQPQLVQLLTDKNSTSAAKRDLLAKVLYGKVTAVTEALALQAIGRPDKNPVDDLASLAELAAGLKDSTIARVTAATALTDAQENTLREKLNRIYGREMSIQTEVDPSLLGGLVIRVGDEIIDGSLANKFAQLRRDLA